MFVTFYVSLDYGDDTSLLVSKRIRHGRRIQLAIVSSDSGLLDVTLCRWVSVLGCDAVPMGKCSGMWRCADG